MCKFNCRPHRVLKKWAHTKKYAPFNSNSIYFFLHLHGIKYVLCIIYFCCQSMTPFIIRDSCVSLECINLYYLVVKFIRVQRKSRINVFSNETILVA